MDKHRNNVEEDLDRREREKESERKRQGERNKEIKTKMTDREIERN